MSSVVAEYKAAEETVRAMETALAEKTAALDALRAAVAKETGALVRLADESGLDDESVFYALRRLIVMLPAELQPADPATMVGAPGSAWSDGEGAAEQ